MARPRLAVIGLDGVGLDLAFHLIERGVMPNLGRLMAVGTAWPTASPLPEVSPVCWTTMFSGQDPGGHGIFGFAHHQPGSYQVSPVDSDAVRAPRLWEQMTATGRRSVVMGVPLTYPASAVNGRMLSGFVAPELSRAVHPVGLLPMLEAAGYRPEADLELARDDPGAVLADVARALEVRLEVFGRLADDDWDLLVAVITDTDRVNHFAWPALRALSHPLHNAALEIYRLADGFIGGLWEQIEHEVAAGGMSLLVAADHSFGPVRSEVYLNPWLMEQGWLTVDGPPGGEVINPATLALALDPGRIYLNWRGRFPAGRLEPGAEAEALIDRIAEALAGLTFRELEQGPEGMTMREVNPVARVHRGRDLFHGPHAHLGPDLVAEAAPGFSLRAGLGRPGVFGLSHITGTHRPEGALALWVPGELPGPRPAHIAGLHGLMTAALGL